MKICNRSMLAALTLARLAQVSAVIRLIATDLIESPKQPSCTRVLLMNELPVFTDDVFTAVKSAQS